MNRTAFYYSKAWRKLSRAFLLSKSYICERCGQPAELTHHKQHITQRNIHDPAVTLNPVNLEALCLNCHNTEHISAGGTVAAGLAFDDNGELRKEN